MNVGVIGCGYWGPNIIRNFNEHPVTKVKWICDLDQSKVEKILKRCPGASFTKSASDILNDTSVEIVAVVTPISTHFEIASAALKAHKHVLISKPMSATVDEAHRLIELSEKEQRIILVDHTFLYHEAVIRVKNLIHSNELGPLHYFNSTRANLGLFQIDSNVVWDLAPHDLSILDYWVDEKPVEVSAFGKSHISKYEDTAYITLNFHSSLIAHISLSWLSPMKIRQTILSGDKKMLVYDDMQTDEKIKIYDKGVTIVSSELHRRYNPSIQYRSGDMYSPMLLQNEALKTEIGHFIDCIEKNRQPLTNGFVGLRIVQLLEAISHSLKKKGEFVKLEKSRRRSRRNTS